MPWHSPAIPNSPMRRSLIALIIVLATRATAAAAQSFDCEVDPSEVVKLGSPITGVLAEVLVKRGDNVARGQPIAVLESTIEASTVRLNRFRAESTARIDAQEEGVKLGGWRVERTGLPRGLVVTQDKYEELRAEARVAEQELLREQQERQLAQLELERSQATLDQRTIRTTIDGIVTEKKLSAGEFVNQEGYIVTLARLDPLHVEVYLPVASYRKTRVGMEGSVHPAPHTRNVAAPAATVVDRVFDPASGTFGVRLTLPNPGNVLPGGQRCKVTFH